MGWGEHVWDGCHLGGYGYSWKMHWNGCGFSSSSCRLTSTKECWFKSKKYNKESNVRRSIVRNSEIFQAFWRNIIMCIAGGDLLRVLLRTGERERWRLSLSVFILLYVPKSVALGSVVDIVYFPSVLQLSVLWKLLHGDRTFQQVNLSKYFKMDIYSHRTSTLLFSSAYLSMHSEVNSLCIVIQSNSVTDTVQLSLNEVQACLHCALSTEFSCVFWLQSLYYLQYCAG